MDLIRDYILFMSLLQCMMAYFLPQINDMAQNPNFYNNVSPIPESGILHTPYEQTETKTTPSFLVTPSWHYRSLDYSDVPVKDEEKNSQSSSYQANLPGTASEETGLKYPLTIPDVKLGFRGTSGMLPVKIQNTPENQPKPPSKILKPISKSPQPVINKEIVGRVQLFKNTPRPELNIKELKQTKPINPNQPEKLALMPKLDAFLIPGVQYTPAPKPELPGMVLNQANDDYPSTYAGIDYKKYEDTLKALQFPSMYKEFSKIEALKPTKFEYPAQVSPGLYTEDNPQKISYKSYVPNIETLKLTHSSTITGSNHSQNLPAIQPTPLYKKIPQGVLQPRQKADVDKDTSAVELPPVPTTMPLLRRIQLTLMNTVAGLPGGSAQTLDSIRAG